MAYHLVSDLSICSNLAGNQFTGNVPYSISTMPKLQYMWVSGGVESHVMFVITANWNLLPNCRNINHNQLQGNITDIFPNLPSLTTV
jgi:hypothetical protein